jgi:hypothetical protein
MICHSRPSQNQHFLYITLTNIKAMDTRTREVGDATVATNFEQLKLITAQQYRPQMGQHLLRFSKVRFAQHTGAHPFILADTVAPGSASWS